MDRANLGSVADGEDVGDETRSPSDFNEVAHDEPPCAHLPGEPNTIGQRQSLRDTRCGERAHEIRDAFLVALDSLEPKLREAFLLKHGAGLDYAEISVITGAGVSALKMRVERACEALRPKLEERLSEP